MRHKGVWILILIGLVLTGCMRGSFVPSESEQPEVQRTNELFSIELEYWHTYSDIETEVFLNKVLPLFEKQYPHIKIKAVRKDYTNQFKDSILFAVADQKEPDIMRMDIIWVPEFAKKGALTELSSMPGFVNLKDKFIGSLIQTNQYRDGYYGLPVNANTRAAIYNKTLLNKAGLTEPPTTFQEIVAATERLQQEYPEVFGIGICCSNGWGSLPYFWSLGGQLTDEKFTQASGFLDSHESRGALQQMKDWMDEGIISRSILGEVPGTWDGILKEQLLMIDDAHWFYTVNSSGANKPLLDDVMIGLFPSDVNMGTSVIGGENLVIFNQSLHKQESWQFIRWMTTEEPQRIMAETGLIPTIEGITGMENNPMFNTYLEQLSLAKPRLPVPNWTEIDDVFARMIERILMNEATIEEATAKAAIQIDKLLIVQ